MGALQLAGIALEGLRILIGLIAGGVALATPADPVPADPAPACFFQETVHESRAFCPSDSMRFTMPEPDEHWAVRR